MPRKRMIDPEFWSDEEIGSWRHSARLLYIGLWNFSDDSGRFKAHNGLLIGQIFPYDPKKGIHMEALKKTLSNKIVWYDVNGYQYGYIRNFLKYQKIDRPTPSKLPPPPEGNIDEQSSSVRRKLVPNRIEVNRRGNNAHNSVQGVVNKYLDLTECLDPKNRNAVFSKYVRDAKALLEIEQDEKKLSAALEKSKVYFESKGLSWSLSAVLKNWHKIVAVRPSTSDRGRIT